MERIKIRHENQRRRDSPETRSNLKVQSNINENRPNYSGYNHRERDGSNIASILDGNGKRDYHEIVFTNGSLLSLLEMMDAKEYVVSLAGAISLPFLFQGNGKLKINFPGNPRKFYKVY